jgi:glycerophosphoryl diester phosphodiesterase
MQLKFRRAPRPAAPRARHEIVVPLLAAVVIVGGVTAAVVLRLALGDKAESLTRPKQPALFQGTAGDLGLGDREVFSVAHNAGDSVEAAAQALAVGARVVEIDVVSYRGELFVSHDRPLPSLGVVPLDAPRLERIWAATAGVDAVVLDLKQSSPLLLVPLVEFLEANRGPVVVVVTRSVLALRDLRDTSPWVRRFLSVRSRIDLERLALDPAADGVVQGVSVRQELLDAPTARQLEERNLVVLAWVVNDVPRVTELASYGVDGIVTDNLAIVERLAEKGLSSLLSAGNTGDDR